MRTALGEVQLTLRGFQRIDFTDLDRQACSLQQSSRANYEPPGSSAVWLGMGDNRCHLELEQVKALVEVLQCWIETGLFAVGSEEGVEARPQ